MDDNTLYRVDKDKINKHIANQPYDVTLPEPEGFTECPSSVQPAPSLYSILLTEPLQCGVTEVSIYHAVYTLYSRYVIAGKF